MRLHKHILSWIALAELLSATVYAPLFHIHADGHGAPLLHTHFPEIESIEDESVVHMEAPDQQNVMRAMMQSTSDFDTWFRETVLVGVHGFDPKAPLPPPAAVVLDHKG